METGGGLSPPTDENERCRSRQGHRIMHSPLVFFAFPAMKLVHYRRVELRPLRSRRNMLPKHL